MNTSIKENPSPTPLTNTPCIIKASNPKSKARHTNTFVIALCNNKNTITSLYSNNIPGMVGLQIDEEYLIQTFNTIELYNGQITIEN
jgi:hypothetical protein